METKEKRCEYLDEMEEKVKNIKCSACGKSFDIFDYQEDFTFDKWIGYGSIHDEQHISFRLCCDCFDKIFDVIKPMIKDVKIEEYNAVRQKVIDLQCNDRELEELLKKPEEKAKRINKEYKLMLINNRIESKIQSEHKQYKQKLSLDLINKEENDKKDVDYKLQIEEFCKNDVVSCSIIQRYFSVGFHTACKLIDKWGKVGIVKREEKFRRVLDKEKLRESLYEFFKNKL